LALCHLKADTQTFEFPVSYNGYLKKFKKLQISDKGAHGERMIDLLEEKKRGKISGVSWDISYAYTHAMNPN